MISGGRWLQIVCSLAVLTACSAPEREQAAAGKTSPAEPPATQSTAARPNASLQTVQLTSDFLERAEYDADARSLTLYFDDGSIYRYSDVPDNVFGTLGGSANDPGPFFNDSIRDRFRFRRLTPAKQRTPRRSTKPPPPRVEIPCPPLERIPKQNVVSVAFDSVSYDPATRCLVLYFDSRHIYRYGSVPVEVYQRLLQPGSDPVVYFNASIRNSYESQRLR